MADTLSWKLNEFLDPTGELQWNTLEALAHRHGIAWNAAHSSFAHASLRWNAWREACDWLHTLWPQITLQPMPKGMEKIFADAMVSEVEVELELMVSAATQGDIRWHILRGLWHQMETRARHIADNLIGTLAGASFQFDDDNEVRKILVRPSKRYTRIIITPSGNASAAGMSAFALLLEPTYAPVTQPAA